MTHVLEKEKEGSNIDKFFRFSNDRFDGLSPARLAARCAIVKTSSPGSPSASPQESVVPPSLDPPPSLRSSLSPESSSSSNQALWRDLFRTAVPPTVRRLTLPRELHVTAVPVSRSLSLSEEYVVRDLLTRMTPLRLEERRTKEGHRTEEGGRGDLGDLGDWVEATERAGEL